MVLALVLFLATYNIAAGPAEISGARRCCVGRRLRHPWHSAPEGCVFIRRLECHHDDRRYDGHCIFLQSESKMPALLADIIIKKMPNVKWVIIALSLFAGIISAFV
jgi:hypothetical protein